MKYVLSDIHGNLANFRSVTEQIKLLPEDTLYVLGDCIDRHPYGIPILRELMAMPNVKMLTGNHEDMMLRVLRPDGSLDTADPRSLHAWLCNGGQPTLDALKLESREVRKEIYAYLTSLPFTYEVCVNGQDYLLTHAAPPALYEEFAPWSYHRYDDQAAFSRWYRLEDEDDLPDDRICIFGHTPTYFYQDAEPLSVYDAGDRIGIDCGSGFPTRDDPRFRVEGRLACLRLDDGRVFYSRPEPTVPARSVL